jgi:hypothetical protein
MSLRLITNNGTTTGQLPPWHNAPNIDLSGLQLEISAQNKKLYISVPSVAVKDALEKIAAISARMRDANCEHVVFTRHDPENPDMLVIDKIVIDF